MHSYQTIAPHTSSLPEATSARTGTVHYPDGRKPCAKQITGPGCSGAHGVGDCHGPLRALTEPWTAATWAVGTRAPEVLISQSSMKDAYRGLALCPPGSGLTSLSHASSIH